MAQVLFDERLFLQSLANDEELARELIDAFLEDGPQRVSDLKEALAVGDVDAASKLAHSLKGMCGVVRVECLSQLALNMEHAARGGKLEAARSQFSSFLECFVKTKTEMNEYLE